MRIVLAGVDAEGDAGASSSSPTAVVTLKDGTATVRRGSGLPDDELARFAEDLREQLAALPPAALRSVASLGTALQTYLEQRNMDSWDDEEEMMGKMAVCDAFGSRPGSCSELADGSSRTATTGQ